MEQTGVALRDAAKEMVHVTKAKGTAIAIANAQMASSVVKIIVTVTSTQGINGGADGMIAVSLPIVYPRQALDAMVLIGSTFEDAVDTMDPAIWEKEIVTRIANVLMA